FLRERVEGLRDLARVLEPAHLAVLIEVEQRGDAVVLGEARDRVVLVHRNRALVAGQPVDQRRRVEAHHVDGLLLELLVESPLEEVVVEDAAQEHDVNADPGEPHEPLRRKLHLVPPRWIRPASWTSRWARSRWLSQATASSDKAMENGAMTAS